MRKQILTFVIFCVGISAVWAQSELDKINTIKKSLNFVYATGTSTVSAQEATDNAKELLTLEIEQWLKEVTEGDFSGYVAKAKNKVEEINTQRGTLMRSFVYVKKTDILPYYQEESIMMVTRDSAPPIDTMHLVVDKPKTTVAPVREVPQVAPPKAASFVPTPLESEMLEVRTFTDINSYLAQGSRDGKISRYGKYENTTQLVDKSYLFLFNKEGNVLAVLKKEGTVFLNLASGAQVTLGDFGRCGIIWFQINEK